MGNREKLLFEEWRVFHRENPEIYQLICERAAMVIARGFKEYAIGTIWETIRWHVTVEVRYAKEFKLPNNHRAYYARLWMREHPEHDKFFKLHKLRSLDAFGRYDRWGRSEDDPDYEGPLS